MRFSVRQQPDGRFGVWDCATSGWRATDLSVQEAQAQAMDLDLIYGAYGPRSAADRRQVEPAVRVERVEVIDGWLHAWVRERNGWHGRVHLDDGREEWVPAGELRPATRPASQLEPTSPIDPTATSRTDDELYPADPRPSLLQRARQAWTHEEQHQDGERRGPAGTGS